MSRADIDRLRLIRTEGIGPVTYRRLLARFGDAAAAIDALPGLMRTRPVIPNISAAESEMEAVRRMGARMLFLGQPGYPQLLALLDDAPAALALLGDVDALTPRAVAMVGSRNASLNGQRMAKQLAQELSEAGLVVVSGMARGIDAAAMRAPCWLGAPSPASPAGWIIPIRTSTSRCRRALPGRAP